MGPDPNRMSVEIDDLRLPIGADHKRRHISTPELLRAQFRQKRTNSLLVARGVNNPVIKAAIPVFWKKLGRLLGGPEFLVYSIADTSPQDRCSGRRQDPVSAGLLYRPARDGVLSK